MSDDVHQGSRIQHMRPTDLTRLCQILDNDDSWKTLVSMICDRYGKLMFENEQIMDIERTCRGTGKSPTRMVLMNWSTSNPTLADLQDKLMEMKHYKAAEFINTKVLKRPGPVLRPTQPKHFPTHPTAPNHSNEKAAIHRHIGAQSGAQVGCGQQENIVLNITIPQNTNAGQASNNSPDGKFDSTTNSETIQKDPYVSKKIDERNTLQPEDDECGSDAPTVSVREGSEVEQEVNVKGVHKFSLAFLQNATGFFNATPVQSGGHLLGEGGFGKVFKGSQRGYPTIAVKRFSKDVIADSEPLAKRQFETELNVLAGCSHENILRLIGYCVEREWCIVYEFMPNGSLEERLACSGGTAPLSVLRRLKIVQEVAHGIDYLHNHTPPLIHRDIKSANILLDKDLTAKIGDCGTVRLGPQSTLNTCTKTSGAIGTMVYMPPEYIENGEVSAKLDSYSFGVVLLEIITGLAPLADNRTDRVLTTHVNEIVDEDDENIYTELVDKKVPWTKALVVEIYQMSKQFRAHKKRRKIISDVLPQIDMWTAGTSESKC